MRCCRVFGFCYVTCGVVLFDNGFDHCFLGSGISNFGVQGWLDFPIVLLRGLHTAVRLGLVAAGDVVVVCGFLEFTSGFAIGVLNACLILETLLLALSVLFLVFTCDCLIL